METCFWIKDGNVGQRVVLPRYIEVEKLLEDGAACTVRALTAEVLDRADGPAALDALGYNLAVPLAREPYTAYATEWVKDAAFVYREVAVVAEPDEEARTAAEAAEVRDLRDLRLALSDWTQLADCPLDEGEKTAWAAYRQELRDVPQQVGFPESVSWPSIPEE
ncbi:tail fiber assembly protein [Pseudodesulfovibrio indicus]|uniref:tail fiber assembly protein n=1 Tax=Pseudodesulfovibrio indicus TaxID=1716143 RepID=UPI002931B873|nr:tail fiber assembly protein [Pseudodesulfovibrio indicus]